MEVTRWARRKWAGTALMLALTTLPSGAHALRCPQPADTRVRVTVHTSYSGIDYRHDLDRAALTNFASGMAITSHGGNILGLTVSRYSLQMETHQQYVQADNGMSCMWIRQVDATLSVPDMTIFVAANYRQGTCQYNAVLEHEYEHVRLTRGLLPGAAKRLEGELRRQLSRINPIVSRNPNSGARVAQDAVQRAMAEFMKRLEVERNRANAAIDTAHSYRRVAARCPQW